MSIVSIAKTVDHNNIHITKQTHKIVINKATCKISNLIKKI